MKITKIASDLNEKSENRYELVYKISALAKNIVEEMNQRREEEKAYGNEIISKNDVKPVIQAIMMIASENDDLGDGLIG